MMACPKCGRQVQPKRTCLYCGAKLVDAPTTVDGLDATGWVHEGTRFIQQSQYERATHAFEKALKIDPLNSSAWAGKARSLVARGERDEAIKCLNEALKIDPNDGQNKALRFRLAQLPQGLPPGRPSAGSVASAFAMESRLYAARAGASLHAELRMIGSPEDILASNWMCAVPPHVGWPGAPREVLAHVFTKASEAFTFYFTPDVRSVPSTRVDDAELAAWGALLQSGRAHAVHLCANVVWSPPMRARVDVVNERLERLGAAKGARIDLLVVADQEEGTG